MGMSFTPDGNMLGDAVSALQKSIRRGETQDAVYFGLQIFKRYPYYLLKRMSVIVVEDIGLANPLLVAHILGASTTLTKSVEFHRKTQRPQPYDVAVAHLLMEMSDSPKSREADHFVHEVLRERRIGVMPYPQETEYDKLVLGMSMEIMAGNEKPALNYLLTLMNGYATWVWPDLTAMAAAVIGDSLVTSTVAHLTAAVLNFFEARQYYEGNFPAYAILLMCRSDKRNTVADLHARTIALPKQEIPDYALDIHTSAGRRLGRDFKHFIEVGSQLVNEAYPSKYRFYDPEHGTASMAADYKTRLPEPYLVSNAMELGRTEPMPRQGPAPAQKAAKPVKTPEPKPDPTAGQASLFG